MHDGRTADAEKEFRDAVRASPDRAEAHLDLGLVLVRQGQLEAAAGELESATTLGPQVPGAHMFLGIAYYQMHRLGEEVTALQQELVLNPDNAEAQMWLGIVELASGNAEKAVAPLDRAAELSPKNLDILDYRGQAHGIVAKDSYAQMYKQSPHSWHVHRLQAELYAEEDRHREAIVEYQAAIAAESNNPDLYEKLGNEYRAINQLEQAQAAFQHELSLSPHNGIAMYNLGSIDVERGDVAKGVPLLEEVARFYAQAPVVKYYLGRGLAESGKSGRAAQMLEEVIKGEPIGELAKRSYFELSRIYRKMQRPADAQRALAEYLKLKTTLEKEDAAKLDDWRKLNETAEGQSPALNP